MVNSKDTGEIPFVGVSLVLQSVCTRIDAFSDSAGEVKK